MGRACSARDVNGMDSAAQHGTRTDWGVGGGAYKQAAGTEYRRTGGGADLDDEAG